MSHNEDKWRRTGRTTNMIKECLNWLDSQNRDCSVCIYIAYMRQWQSFTRAIIDQMGILYPEMRLMRILHHLNYKVLVIGRSHIEFNICITSTVVNPLIGRSCTERSFFDHHYLETLGERK